MVVADFGLNFYVRRRAIVKCQRGAVEILAIIDWEAEQSARAEAILITDVFTAQRNAELRSEVSPEPATGGPPFGRITADIQVEVVEFGREGQLVLSHQLTTRNQ